MRKQKNELATLSPQQSNPYTAVPEDFEIGRADEFSDNYVPGHGQCGKNEKEYDTLLEQADSRGKPPLGLKRTLPTEVDDASKPHGDGMGAKK